MLEGSGIICSLSVLELRPLCWDGGKVLSGLCSQAIRTGAGKRAAHCLGPDVLPGLSAGRVLDGRQWQGALGCSGTRRSLALGSPGTLSGAPCSG